uniref:MYCBP associated protein n=2 Tax=Rhinopithecus TaxID=542827 RepID=A0A2K6KL23_RHIBE
PAQGAGCYGRSGGRWLAGVAAQPRCLGGHAYRRDGTMKSLKKDSRLKITPARLLEAAESFKGWHAGGRIPRLDEVQKSQERV